MKSSDKNKMTIGQRRRLAAQRYAQSLEAKEKYKYVEIECKVNKSDDSRILRKKKKTITAISVISVLLVLSIIIGVCVSSFMKQEMFGGYDKETHGDVLLDDELKGVYTCLLVATDKSKANTDTIMLAVLRYDDVKKIDLISIPRDTRVLNPSGNGGHVKINSIMARNGGKINALVTEVRNITGIPINDFMLVSIEAVKKSVDLFGGVMFDVPMNMHYEDPLQNLKIHLNKGMQRIDGNKAEQLLRYRYGYADADLGRTKVQRDFMIEAIKQHAKVSNLGKISKWYSEMGDYIQTQITYDKAYKFATIITGDEFEINSRILPGTVIAGSPDYFYDAKEINKMAKELGFDEGAVVSTPYPNINIDSGEAFGEEQGPASTILEEVPAETVVPTDPGIGDSSEDKPQTPGKNTAKPTGDDDRRPTRPTATDNEDDEETKPASTPSRPVSDGRDDNDGYPDGI